VDSDVILLILLNQSKYSFPIVAVFTWYENGICYSKLLFADVNCNYLMA
jgi:hypothetical protein